MRLNNVPEPILMKIDCNCFFNKYMILLYVIKHLNINQELINTINMYDENDNNLFYFSYAGNNERGLKHILLDKVIWPDEDRKQAFYNDDWIWSLDEGL